MAEFKYEGRDLEAMSFAKRYHDWILSMFTPFIGKRVAEVGAGSGSFTELLAALPVEELVAIEPSEEMYDRLAVHTKDDARITCRNAFFGDVSGTYPNHFDAIVYVNVLEHVEDDEGELAQVYRALAPGGYVCIFVPALSWLYSEHDASIGHFRRYHKKQLKALLVTAGFSVPRVKYFDIAGIIPWFLLMKVGKLHPAPGSVDLYDRFVVPVSRILEAHIPLPFGKNLVIVGQKPK